MICRYFFSLTFLMALRLEDAIMDRIQSDILFFLAISFCKSLIFGFMAQGSTVTVFFSDAVSFWNIFFKVAFSSASANFCLQRREKKPPIKSVKVVYRTSNSRECSVNFGQWKEALSPTSRAMSLRRILWRM